MAKRPNQAVPVHAAFRRLLPLTVALTVVATVLATVERLAGPVWMPAAAAIAGALVNAAWMLTIGRRLERVVMIEPLPGDWRVIDPSVSATRIAVRASPVLIVPALLGSAHHHGLFDLALTAFAPAACGALVARTVMLIRRVGRRERTYQFTLLAAAGPFEGCGGRRRLFAVSDAAPATHPPPEQARAWGPSSGALREHAARGRHR